MCRNWICAMIRSLECFRRVLARSGESGAISSLLRSTVLWLLLGPAGAWAETLFCPPLQPPVRTETASVAHGKGLLWKLELGTAPASYVYGTIHVGDPRVTALPEPVQSALRDSRRFVMEALFEPAAVAEFAAAMSYQDGSLLEERVGKALYVHTEELLARFGIPAPAVERLRPWAAFMTLNQPEGDNGLPLDLVLMQHAQNEGLTIHGLETLREQAEVFAALSESDQFTLLRDTVCNFDRVQAEITRLRDLYLARDLAGIVTLGQHYESSDPDLSERLQRALIHERNMRMVQRLQPFLREGGVFIAIGALHLPGEEGVLGLLAAQGVRVEMLY
jgi:uncharacterized protein YbaP (TraB family)